MPIILLRLNNKKNSQLKYIKHLSNQTPIKKKNPLNSNKKNQLLFLTLWQYLNKV